MSSSDRSRRALLAAGLGAALLVAGCQVRPLYGSGAGSNGGAVAALSQIAVQTQRERLDQVLMNELIFALRGGSPLTDPRYTLRLITTSSTSELAIRANDEVPAANLIALTVTYTLTENVTGRVVTNGTVHRTASYDFSSQRFANLRAFRDAEDRAARAVAEDIRLRLATVLATAA